MRHIGTSSVLNCFSKLLINVSKSKYVFERKHIDVDLLNFVLLYIFIIAIFFLRKVQVSWSSISICVETALCGTFSSLLVKIYIVVVKQCDENVSLMTFPNVTIFLSPEL